MADAINSDLEGMSITSMTPEEKLALMKRNLQVNILLHKLHI